MQPREFLMNGVFRQPPPETELQSNITIHGSIECRLSSYNAETIQSQFQASWFPSLTSKRNSRGTPQPNNTVCINIRYCEMIVCHRFFSGEHEQIIVARRALTSQAPSC